MIRTGFILLLGVASFFPTGAVAATSNRILSVADAVSTRRLSENVVQGELALSPDGTRVAYILKAPDVQRNTNNYELHIRDLDDYKTRDNGRILLRAQHLSSLVWLREGQWVAVIETTGTGPDRRDSLVLLDIHSRRKEIIHTPTNRIRAFSISRGGTRIVLCAAVGRKEDTAEQNRRNRYGFRVVPGEPIQDPALIEDWFPDSYLYLAEISPKQEWTLQKLHSIGDPDGRIHGEVGDLTLSPNGKLLLFKYQTDITPKSWNGSLYSAQRQISYFPLLLWGMLNLETHQLQIAFDAPALSYVAPVWSSDSRFFAISTLPPKGSSWEEQDQRDGMSAQSLQFDPYLHLFVVDAETHAISEALHRFRGISGDRIVWGTNHSLLVTLGAREIVHLVRDGGIWKQKQRLDVFSDPRVRIESVARSARFAIGLREDESTPPDLVLTKVGSNEIETLTDWNPQYRQITLGKIEEVRWNNKYGVPCFGYLIKPVGYLPGKRYPLVVMNRARKSFFISDGSYTTAFPPQSLAGNGFAVLMAEYAFADKDLPHGFPGQISEAFNWMAMVESGIEELVSRGVVDKSKVGIIGFSRTSWKTDFMLTHSDFPFAAASSADGGLYNYGAYWMNNYRGAMNDAEAMLGGPPYGKSFENWLKYTSGFNADKVRCPVLMEYTGYGHEPYGPIQAFEFFTALYRQNKPVELYFYPYGDHPLDTPSERVASLQRNVDWFRFWIQGYEGTPPNYDPHQYERWRLLRSH